MTTYHPKKIQKVLVGYLGVGLPVSEDAGVSAAGGCGVGSGAFAPGPDP